MTTAIITLFSKGQVVIPREIRDVLRWRPGEELELVTTASSVTLRAKSESSQINLADPRGSLKYRGPPPPWKSCANRWN